MPWTLVTSSICELKRLRPCSPRAPCAGLGSAAALCCSWPHVPRFAPSSAPSTGGLTRAVPQVLKAGRCRQGHQRAQGQADQSWDCSGLGDLELGQLASALASCQGGSAHPESQPGISPSDSQYPTSLRPPRAHLQCLEKQEESDHGCALEQVTGRGDDPAT